MSAFCPHCGYDIRLDTPVLINDFLMLGPGCDLFYQGHEVRLTGSEGTLMFSLMKAYPEAVTIDSLLDRMGSAGAYNTIAVFATRIRHKLKAIGAPIPFEAKHAFGRRYMRWKS